MDNKIILASSSPRRQQLLTEIKIDYDIVETHIEEGSIIKNWHKGDKKLAKHLAYLKAIDVAQKNPNRIILGADTIVVCEKKIIGKPKDMDDAKEILKFLSDKKHKVITGVCLLYLKEMFVWKKSATTIVNLYKLTDAEIDDYLSKEDVLNAAGAYMIQGMFSRYVKNLDGSYHNVVGLPVNKVYQGLKKAGFIQF